MNKRELKLDEYGITSKRYKELCGFCEQYPEWKDELRYKTDTVKSLQLTDEPHAKGGISDTTSELAILRSRISANTELIERVSKEAGEDLSEYIIKSVCYEKPFWYLRDIMGMPCSQSAFYDRRRYFFYLLDKEKK